MARSHLVTLMTDFGTRDPYVAAMKGAILSTDPQATIVDLSHDLPAHDVLAAAFALAQAAPWFPPDTLHVVVVDPGVGTDRRILAARFGKHSYLFPDNGIITFIAASQPLQSIVAVHNRDYLPSGDPSTTFHGRDIFAPVAGRMLRGLDIRRLGEQPDSYKLLDLPEAVERDGALVGQVIYVDRFGNLVTNISRKLVLERWEYIDRVHVSCGPADVGAIQGAYDFVPQGQALALFNSMELLEVAVNRGRACDALDAAFGTEIRLVSPATGT